MERSLRPNVELWRQELNAEGLDLKEVAIARGFLFLAFSFERRTIPRMQQARAVGVPGEANPSGWLPSTLAKLNFPYKTATRRPILGRPKFVQNQEHATRPKPQLHFRQFTVAGG